MKSGVYFESHTLCPDLDLVEPAEPATIDNKPVSATDASGNILSTNLNILTAGPDSASRLIVGLPWSEFVARPDATDRYRALATAASAQLRAVDVPGMSAESANLPTRLAREVNGGSFDNVAQLQWQSLELGSGNQEVTLLGYSMGAHIVAALARTAPENIQIKRIMLWESVSQRQSIAKLAAKLAFEERRSASYRQENPAWLQPAGSLRAAFPGTKNDYLNYAIGISRGNLGISLIEAWRRKTITEQTEIDIIGGSASRVSSPDNNTDLAHFLHYAAGRIAVRQIEFVGESHSMINSAPRMVAALETIN